MGRAYKGFFEDSNVALILKYVTNVGGVSIIVKAFTINKVPFFVTVHCKYLLHFIYQILD